MAKYKGLITGILFFIISFALAFTIVVPMWTNFGAMMLHVGIDSAISYLFGNDSLYTYSAILTTILLFTLVLFLFKIIFKHLKKTMQNQATIKISTIIGYFCIVFIPLQSLGFFLLWGIEGHFIPDALILLSSIISFPIVGILFIPFGISIDFKIKTYNSK